MADEVNIRNLALDVIVSVMDKGAYSDKAVHDALEKHQGLEKRDRSFFTRLCQGTIEYAVESDYIIDSFSKTKVKKMKPVIRGILRMGVYQILHMDSVPDSAVCNEAVKLANKRKFTNLKGFVNGVLRNISREKDNIKFPEKKDGFCRYASVRYSMPEWIVEYFSANYGEVRTEKIFEGFLKADRGVSVRCNISKAAPGEVFMMLQKQGIKVEKSELFDYAFTIDGFDRITDIDAFNMGYIQVQDQSSILAGHVSVINGGEKIIDICAAPGGKTMHAADRLKAVESGNAGKIISCDLTKQKADLIRENVERTGFDNVSVIKNDALVYKKEWENTADIVIADLPCSGLGVIGKKCDIKYKTTKEDIISLSEIQRKILQNASRYLKKGGQLLYSTCTIAREENEDNVEWILENLPFKKADISKRMPEGLRKYMTDDSYIQILPDMAQTDGFFVAAFIKK
ncbi:16S rRNA (cytosine(967)-C(5))-methyltransferase RsmB [Eubacterium sp. MSJ-13]|uniref:16S rRNA (cytosine(967)-C(5))-methyltransferase RsmB n=1 Tax=Eubacterium sp. MSJ-13 TaxID=2841513 RepID=UPI001C10B773|nr:16S rRNA (cytosine(967)-C(5))-methyltransferase RsmB [Eubacterium sp. MSJ-13]MBU5479312.1 16S rRNA (cytosine(967)-C(5))-methyltransferase RsmB [Eubacterium sp. MSJ-13]